jgi:hypothetical protein
MEHAFSGANCVIVNPDDNSIERILPYVPAEEFEMSLCHAEMSHA